MKLFPLYSHDWKQIRKLNNLLFSSSLSSLSKYSGYTIKENNKIHGFILYEKWGDYSSYIGRIAVSSEMRGKGIGRNLLQHSLENEENKFVYLNVRKNNQKAKNLYLHLGFQIVEKIEHYYSSPDDDGYTMVWIKK